MKIIAICFATFVFSLCACAQKPPDSHLTATTSAKLDTTLPWLQLKIWDYQSKPVSNPPRSIIKTTFEGKPVYYVPPVCCDIPSELYAEDGKLICYPGGGFAGAGDGKCPKFRIEYLDNIKDNKDNKDNKNYKNSKTKIVWEDKRNPVPSTKVIPDLQ